MHLIYYPGLNCHLASLLSIADSLGINITQAYANLWSEMDFEDDPIHNVYLSKRVYANLSALGITAETLTWTTRKSAEERLSQVFDQEPFLVDMDTFYTPWSPVYQHFYGPHYFIAQKDSDETLSCFDPVFDKEDVKMEISDLLDNANGLSRVHKVAVGPWQWGGKDEAKAALYGLPVMRATLGTEIQACKAKDRRQMSALIKQITAMLNNRHLFHRYWLQTAEGMINPQSGFDERFFLQWEAVKNGLVKASILRQIDSVVDEVHGLFEGLMDQEGDMAERAVRGGV